MSTLKLPPAIAEVALPSGAAEAALGPGDVRVPRLAPLAATLAALSAGAVPFAAFTGLVLYHFYVKGAFLLDSGVQAFLVAHSDLGFATPRAWGGWNFLLMHITPVFLGTSLLRQMLPLSDSQFFAGFIGFCHALPAVGVFWLLYSRFGLRSPRRAMLAAVIAVAFAFNGLALAIARYPHFEMLVVGSAILFLVALSERRYSLAALFLAVSLLTREDAGLHLFGVLAVAITLRRWGGVRLREQRTELIFALVAVGYSACVVLGQSVLSPLASPLVRNYFGGASPGLPAAQLILERLAGCATYRAYIVLPALVALVWAIRQRNPLILAGYVAFVPWLLLQVVSRNEIPATLSGYYAYPFLIASFWPLLAASAGGRVPATSPASVLVPFAAMIAVSFVAVSQQYNPGGLDLPRDFVAVPSIAQQNRTEQAVAAVVAGRSALGATIVDEGIVALAPDSFAANETVAGAPNAHPDTVVYFANGYDSNAARKLASTTGLGRCYRVTGTAVRVASRRDLSAFPIAAMLRSDEGQGPSVGDSARLDTCRAPL